MVATRKVTGEIAYGRRYHKELLDKRGAEILQTDAVVCAGVTEWRRIAAMAASYASRRARTGSTTCTAARRGDTECALRGALQGLGRLFDEMSGTS